MARETVVEGWLYPFGPGETLAYFALLEEPPCCAGCLPRDPERRIEVFAATPIPRDAGKLRLRGRLARVDHSSGWRWQLRDAVRLDRPITRRRALAAGTLACAAVALPGDAALAARADFPTIDIHTHAGGVNQRRRVTGEEAFGAVADPMRAGGMAVLCLATTPDGPTHHVAADGRIHPFRNPAPGELYAYGTRSFAAMHQLAAAQNLAIITDSKTLAAARSGAPAIIVASEGADFLEGHLPRVDEAYTTWRLRHLQLTHYRVNELGDIQTEPPVHGGLTPFGAEVVRRCNTLGIVVDVAHGTYDLVKQAAGVTTKPLVLSHTSLTRRPRPFTRLITPDHARAIAGTGGIIGIWPPAHFFPTLEDFAAGIAHMVDVVGIDHVGLGSDMAGLVGPSVFPSYRHLPDLVTALSARGFAAAEIARLLGGNYLRVFTETLA